MSKPITPRLYLISPLLSDADAFAPILEEACAAGDIAAVLFRLPQLDSRQQVNILKQVAPIAQRYGAAALASSDDLEEIATVAARGGADGIQIDATPDLIAEMRRRIGADRILGIGGLSLRDDAMAAGEAGADYLLFGAPLDDGSIPDIDATTEKAAWWAEIFETPCVVFAPSLAATDILAATGAEFVALGDAVWWNPDGAAAAVKQALSILSNHTVAG